MTGKSLKAPVKARREGYQSGPVRGSTVYDPQTMTIELKFPYPRSVWQTPAWALAHPGARFLGSYQRFVDPKTWDAQCWDQHYGIFRSLCPPEIQQLTANIEVKQI